MNGGKIYLFILNIFHVYNSHFAPLRQEKAQLHLIKTAFILVYIQERHDERSLRPYACAAHTKWLPRIYKNRFIKVEEEGHLKKKKRSQIGNDMQRYTRPHSRINMYAIQMIKTYLEMYRYCYLVVSLIVARISSE